MSRLDATISQLDRLIAYPTVSKDSNHDLINDVAERLEGLGAAVHVQASPAGDKANLFASFGGAQEGGIVLSGHSDVVPAEEPDWQSDPFQMRQIDGKLYGRGSCDMKGFIAAVMAIAPDLATASLKRPVHIALTYDEEVGCLGARHLVEELRQAGIRPSLAIVGEPTEMGMVEGHKGCCEYTTRFRGLEGHSSQPDKGVSAVEYAVRLAAHLLEMREALKARAPEGSRFDPPYSTLQIGQIAGGVAHNVIAGSAEMDWDFRPINEADKRFLWERVSAYIDEELLPAMQRVAPEAAIETETIGDVVGLEPVEDNKARALVAALTGANAASCVSFGTEAGLFQGLGMDVVLCGPGSIAQAHKANEFVAIDQLERCVAMLEKLVTRIS